MLLTHKMEHAYDLRKALETNN